MPSFKYLSFAVFASVLLAFGLLFSPLAQAADGHDHQEEHAREAPTKKEGGHKEDAHEGHGDHEKQSGHEEEDGHSDHGKEDGHGGHDDHGHGGEEEHSDSTVITPKAAKESGIATAIADAATIRQMVLLTGQISLNQNRLAQVKARFPGIVREVRKGMGDTVTAGETLALVESNDSLQVYPVKAPLSGVVLARTTNVGDVAGDAALFQIADVSDVWAEFHIFPKDADRIHQGQSVVVHNTGGTLQAEGQITSLLPVAEAASQTIIARVPLKNSGQKWRSGMIVRGDAVVAEKSVALAVPTSAIQRMEGKTVVFVQERDTYAMRPVEPGMSDGKWTEIRHGLKRGEQVVAQGSFTVKADIGKAGAAHEH